MRRALFYAENFYTSDRGGILRFSHTGAEYARKGIIRLVILARLNRKE